jgi:methionyl-tRNA formyltransferase
MMKNKRIVFFGTPTFAKICLDKMIKEGCNVVAVVTAPDKASGRGKKINSSAIKQFALNANLPILQPVNLKDPLLVEELKSFQPDLFVVVAFRMLPEVVWSLPPLRTFNLHASLLPNYRGAAPINWAIINGEKNSGVSTFYIDDKIDSGGLLMQASIELATDETVGTLHDKLAKIGSELICQTVKGLAEGSLSEKQQQLTGFEKTAPKLNNKNVSIDWNLSLKQIESHIRGLNPHPGARTSLTDENKTEVMKVLRSTIEKMTHDFENYQLIVQDKKILISHPEGFLVCEEVQLPNKKRMLAVDLLNGYTFSSKISVK